MLLINRRYTTVESTEMLNGSWYRQSPTMAIRHIRVCWTLRFIAHMKKYNNFGFSTRLSLLCCFCFMQQMHMIWLLSCYDRGSSRQCYAYCNAYCLFSFYMFVFCSFLLFFCVYTMSLTGDCIYRSTETKTQMDETWCDFAGPPVRNIMLTAITVNHYAFLCRSNTQDRNY